MPDIIRDRDAHSARNDTKTFTRVRNRANGVGDSYIDIAPTTKKYNHTYTHKIFTPMFIFVISMMAIFYFTVV